MITDIDLPRSQGDRAAYHRQVNDMWVCCSSRTSIRIQDSLPQGAKAAVVGIGDNKRAALCQQGGTAAHQQKGNKEEDINPKHQAICVRGGR
ncbi:MAG: hypothetical protein H6557_11010 [Lewinellaceae bacterium]|nr:hypothetical protein [Phaeodactylibacter sp.]MCB9037139.1 hypothetical protein [Lewinellaceae bacterium]